MCADACCRQTTALQWVCSGRVVQGAVGSRRCCQVGENSFSERACCWKGRQVSVWERVSVLHWKCLQCLLTCLWFPLLIQGCRQREGNCQSAERARLSEKCFWAAEEKEQRKEILPPPSQKIPQNNQTCVPSTPWGMGHFAESVSDSCVLHCVPGCSLPLGVTQHTYFSSELCQLLHNLLLGWEEGDLLGDTSHSKFLDLDSNLVNPVQKRVLWQGQGGWEEQRCCALTELWSLCVDVGGGITFRVLRSASSHSSEWLILMFQRKWRTEPSFTTAADGAVWVVCRWN